MEAGTLTVVIVIAVIFVNGATDAPNSVAGAVSDGTLSYPAACTVCAVFNFAGMLLSSMFFPSVEASMASLTSGGVAGVQIALVSVVLFSSAAWFFGIPTSESHGLIASLGGVSLYYSGTAGDAFLDITLKSVVSCIVGFFVGFVFLFLMRPMFGDRGFFREKGRRSTLAAMCAGGASFCHGMQDGQKFMAMLAVGTGGGRASVTATVICAAVMACGCFAGGRRIIDKLGRDLTETTSEASGAASDLGAFVCTVASSLVGVPVSTTYMKTCSMLGSAAAHGRRINRRTFAELIFTWGLTYPVCMGTAYVLCALFETIF